LNHTRKNGVPSRTLTNNLTPAGFWWLQFGRRFTLRL